MSKKLVIKKRITYKDVIITVITTFIIYLLTMVFENSYFGTAFYLSLLYLGLNPFLSSFVYIVGGLLTFSPQVLYPSLITAIIMFQQWEMQQIRMPEKPVFL